MNSQKDNRECEIKVQLTLPDKEISNPADYLYQCDDNYNYSSHSASG